MRSSPGTPTGTPNRSIFLSAVRAARARLAIDRQIVELMREPLRHLLVNAVDHGIELPEVRVAKGKAATGVVRVAARVVDDRVEVSVIDDGGGDEEHAEPQRDAPAQEGQYAQDERGIRTHGHAPTVMPGTARIER